MAHLSLSQDPPRRRETVLGKETSSLVNVGLVVADYMVVLTHLKVEGKSIEFVLDAGAEASTITENTCKTLVLNPSKSDKVLTGADNSRAVLLQLNGKHWKPVAYASRKLSKAETKYAMIVKRDIGNHMGL